MILGLAPLRTRKIRIADYAAIRKYIFSVFGATEDDRSPKLATSIRRDMTVQTQSKIDMRKG